MSDIISKPTDLALAQLILPMRRFVATIHEDIRNDFFHPINRDMWMEAFGEFLAKKPEFASND